MWLAGGQSSRLPDRAASPDHLRDRLLHNQIDLVLTRALRTRTDIILTRVTIPLQPRDDDDDAGPGRRACGAKPDKATGPKQSRT